MRPLRHIPPLPLLWPLPLPFVLQQTEIFGGDVYLVYLVPHSKKNGDVELPADFVAVL